jgi:hypothetical protein
MSNTFEIKQLPEDGVMEMNTLYEIPPVYQSGEIKVPISQGYHQGKEFTVKTFEINAGHCSATVAAGTDGTSVFLALRGGCAEINVTKTGQPDREGFEIRMYGKSGAELDLIRYALEAMLDALKTESKTESERAL